MIRLLYNTFLFFALCLLLIGCGSAQQTSDEDNVTEIHEQTADVVSPAQEKHIQTKNSAAVTPKKKFQQKNKKSPVGFAVTSDTIVVEKGKKDLQKQQVQKKVTEPQHFFTIQIGAFKTPANAMRAEETVKKRYKQKTVSFFDEQLKLIRVFVGNFPSAKKANEFRKSIQQEHPKEYQTAFVWELNR